MQVFRWLDKYFEEIFLGVFMFIMTTVIALQVFMRYVLQDSLPWSEELARYCFIWLVYLGISYAVKTERHMRIDVLHLVLKDKGKAILGIIGNLVFLAFAVFAIVYGSQISMKLLTWGQTSPALSIPVGLVYLAGPVGMGLTAIRLIQQLVQHTRFFTGKEIIR